MGVPIIVFLENSSQDVIWRCVKCGVDIAADNDLISTDFQGKYGPAKLFAITFNTMQYDRHHSKMTTGTFIIDHIRCRHCEEYLGWTYIESYQPSERYKVGRFILEDERVACS